MVKKIRVCGYCGSNVNLKTRKTPNKNIIHCEKCKDEFLMEYQPCFHCGIFFYHQVLFVSKSNTGEKLIVCDRCFDKNYIFCSGCHDLIQTKNAVDETHCEECSNKIGETTWKTTLDELCAAEIYRSFTKEGIEEWTEHLVRRSTECPCHILDEECPEYGTKTEENCKNCRRAELWSDLINVNFSSDWEYICIELIQILQGVLKTY